MIKLREKIFICIISAVMILTQIPAGQSIYVEQSKLLSVAITDVDSDSKQIEVNEVDEGITKVGLYLNDTNIQTKDVSEDILFTIHTNGMYVVKGFDVNDELKTEESIEVSTFEDFTVVKDAITHEVKIVSRYNLTDKIVINKEEEVTAILVEAGYYVASYIISKNGEYTFDVIDVDGQEVASKTIQVTDIANIGETGEFIIKSEADLKQISDNPSGTFVLENDIEMTSNSLAGINFTGSLNGNGYMISGFSESLFNSIENATINNIIIKGSLANTSSNSTISNTGFYVDLNNDEKDSAVILKSDNTTIKNSFAFMNVEAKLVAGFILEGTGLIEHSYVSGYLKGSEVYGFGKEVDVKNSYITASIIGDNRTLFTSGEIEDSFYDAQINDLEELKATPMYTKDMVSIDFENEEFNIIEGQYPQIKNIEEMKEKAQAVSTLSVQAVKTDSNLSTLKGSVETGIDSEEIEWNKEKDEVSAKSNDIINRFALKEARAVSSITAGESTNAKTTQITYPIEMGTYYKVVLANTDNPPMPRTHKEAIESGWKIMYWEGDYKQAGLEWNTSYNVMGTNLISLEAKSSIKTNYGKNGGKVTLTGTYDDGQTMTATLLETNTTKGTMYFESAATLDATNWTSVSTVSMDGTSNKATYQVVNALKGKYLRARFVADETTGYKGEVTDKVVTVFKEEITGVTIDNRTTMMGDDSFKLNNQLYADMTPTGNENDVIYKWYHEGGTDAIATGNGYVIRASDIGKKLFVRAEAKENGIFKGHKDSQLTSVVEGIQKEKPTATNYLKEVSKDDITVTLTMEIPTGLFRYGYRVNGTSDSITPYSILARNNTNTTITGLNPNTKYDFYVQEVGENGFTDSDWSSDSVSITTDKVHVKGDVVVSGKTIYNQTLTATLKNNPSSQKGEFVWYRIEDNGSRTLLAANTATYILIKENIGKKIEVAYQGTESYAGEISTITDTISKEEIAEPNARLTVEAFDETSITVKMPNNATGEKYILGISKSMSGVPIEHLNGSVVIELGSEEVYKITGLDRDTLYFLHIRYAENDLHQKSDWVELANMVGQKTNVQAFTGNITFTYETNSGLFQGQTLIANLKPTDSTSFNYKGEWKWTRIDATGQSKEISNFTLTYNKQGTEYVVPAKEDVNVSYKVEFIASTGYEGSVTATSSKVQENKKPQYPKPDAAELLLGQIDDTSITAEMVTEEGKYRFWYKKADATPWDSVKGFFNKTFVDPNDGYRELKIGTDTGFDVLANSAIVISGLERDADYLVRVQRVGDDNGSASEYSDSANIRTGKTEIAGYVTIGGNTVFNERLTATYHSAKYASTGSGSDTQGQWQWYRGVTPITNAKSNSYILKEEDINQVLTVKYSMPSIHSFKGEVEAKTTAIQKAEGISPKINSIDSKVINGKMSMTVIGDLGSVGTDSVYYRVQQSKLSEPTELPTYGSALPAGWHKVTSATMNINEDYLGNDLDGSKEYTVYFIKTATATTESTRMFSEKHTTGTFQVQGAIRFVENSDVAKEEFVVGHILKAELGSSISDGTWKWYKSTAKYNGTNITNPPASNDTSWIEIASGFSQTPDNKFSSLNLSEDLFGYFIRAEFVANPETGFSGSLHSGGNRHVRKMYDEKLTITSDSKDGNGDPKAYAKTKITGTIENYAESGNLNRATVHFNIEGTTITPTIANGTFTYTMPNDVNYDGKKITAEVSTPKTIGLYVDTDLKPLTSKIIDSGTSTSTSVPYTAGVPISNRTDLENFMKRAAGYDDYSVNARFVVTNDIDMSLSVQKYSADWHYFQGVFDGDYHIISGLKTYLFHYIANKDFIENKSSDVGSATIKNLIILNSDVDIGGSAGTLARTSITDLTIERVMSLDSKIKASMYAGLLMGRSDVVSNRAGNYKLTINEVMSAGGNVSSTNDPSNGDEHGAGALIGSFSIPTELKNVSTVSTTVTSKYRTGGIIGNVDKHSTVTDANILTLYNVLVSSRLSGTVTGANASFGPVIGKRTNGNIAVDSVFYDSTIFPSSSNEYGRGSPTEDLIGVNLLGRFGYKWTYKGGYYPRLAWLEENPMAILYTATRGAFISVDRATSATDMLNGTIHGPIQIPAELQTKDFRVQSSSSGLQVTSSGTIIPVGPVGTTGTITITYTKPDSPVKAVVKNTFDFTVGTKVNAMDAVSIVDNATGSALSTAPKMNQTLSVNAAQGTSWQWYRRRSGSTTKEEIPNANSKTYRVQPGDVGYEISVLVMQSGYASTYSSNTSAAVSITPKAPYPASRTDSSITVQAEDGDSSFKYEFAYLRSDQNAVLTPIEGTYEYNERVTINNLQRNTKYKFYNRIAKADDGSYPASAWSASAQQATGKTNITGIPTLGSAINNGAELTMVMATTNGQTGTWKLERLEPYSERVLATLTEDVTDVYTAKYILSDGDVGNRIRATYVGNGDFQGEASATSEVIRRGLATAPSEPTEVNKTDKNIVVKMAASGNYDIAYATEPAGPKTIIFDNVTGLTNITIPSLTRNKDYYIFARKSQSSTNEASGWSGFVRIKTLKTNVAGTITQTDSIKVDQNVGFTMPRNTQLNVEFTGVWKIERVKKTGSTESTTTISPSKYTVMNNVITYRISPMDAGSILRVTYTGKGDFDSSVVLETVEVANAEQSFPTGSHGIISEVQDHSLKVRMSQGTGTYQFGYRLNNSGTINVVDSAVLSGTDVLIEGLNRNSPYAIFVRRAAKQGYKASEWVGITTTHKTGKSALTGTIEYVKVENGLEAPAKVGVAEVGATYKAKYISGTYSQSGDDTAGKWQWYADGNPIPGAIYDLYTIEPMLRVNEISVRFTAADTSDFKDYRSASIGTLTKQPYEPPTTLPTVTYSLENGEIGSELNIDSHELVYDFYYYVQKADNAKVPATILASDVGDEVKADQWFKATNSTMTLNLEANTSYVVYVARLEDGSHLSSGVISQRAVRTAKDDISKINSISIKEADTSVVWKVLQDKELRIHRDNKPVEGVWQYYVSQTKDVATSWQNITAEIKVNSTEGNTSTYSFTRVNVPLKYANGYYFRAVFTGRGDLEGSETYTSSKALIGTQLKGSAVLNTGNSSAVFVPIEAKYVYRVENGQNVIDEENGIWTWYREEGGTDTIVKSGTVGIEDDYKPDAADVGKKIYAVYASAPNGIYSGKVTSNKLENVTRAVQNTPDAISLRQVNGTSIQISLPTNMITTGKTVAQPELEYSIKDSGVWTKNTKGNAWITGLNANTDYEIRASFVGTTEFLPSSYGAIINVRTANQSFDEESLVIDQPNIFQSGDLIGATYSGSGYDEGYFVIKRSDGKILKDNVEGTITNGFLFKAGSTRTEYKTTSEDIGSNIIVEFKAKNNALTYGGSIEKSTKEVLKPANKTQAGSPTLNTVQYDETKLRVVVNDDNEYVFNESATPISATSGEWQKLKRDAGQNYHTFTGLDKTKNYYLHVRTAETKEFRYSVEDVSAATTPWASTLYKIVYNGIEGATNGSPTNPSQYTELSANIVLNDASKVGYTFLGWTTSTITTPTKGLIIPTLSSGVKTFTANWQINKYDAKFDSNGGVEAVQTINKNYQEALGKLPVATRVGYELAGWYTNNDGTGDKILETTTMPADGATYYAHWTIKQYTVTYDSKLGTAVSPAKADYDTLLTEPNSPTRDGYRFAGWYKDEGYQTPWDFAKDKIADSNITLYAKWNQIYQLSFDKNTGVGQMANVEFIQGESITLPKNTFTKDGFAFTGWNTQADGKGTTYDDEAVLSNGLNTDTVLYATWKTQVPSVFIDIPRGLSLIDDKDSKTAIKEDEVKIVKNVEDANWYPDEDIEIRTDTSITLTNEDTSYTYEVEVYKADGNKHTDSTAPLAVLSVKDPLRQSSKFTLKTPINYSMPKGIYKGSMNFIIEFVQVP